MAASCLRRPRCRKTKWTSCTWKPNSSGLNCCASGRPAKVCVRQYLNFKIGNKDDQARLVAARAEREETRGKIEKMRMEEAQGDLHRTEDVERALKTIFANFKNRLETIPTKYANTMAQLTDPAEAHDILQKAVQEALVELSDPEIALAAPAGEEPEDEQEE